MKSEVEKREKRWPVRFWDQSITSIMTKKDEREPVIDPALREDMSASPRRHFESSPPPIPPIPNSHSPSPSVVSVDRSSNSTPHIRRSSPPMPSYPYYDRYRQDHHHHHPSGYLYAPPPPFDPRYDHHPHYPHHLPPPDAPGHHYSPGGLPTHYIPNPMSHPPPAPPQSAPPVPYGHHYGPMPGQPPVQVVHTSDANTKLTDGIRRRCFNCCTTDTSTWRRSNLSPGKVLCNKCGLFERTHSRPRPEQFPHKRGALASSNLRGRTPPTGPAPPQQLPSLAAATGPYQYHHTSLTPLNAPPADYMHHPHHQQPQQHANTLPGLQSWHANTSISSASSGGNGGAGASATNGQSNTNNNNGNNSNGATEPPALLTRRSGPIDSPRMPSGASTPVSAGRLQFDDRLASNSTAAVGVDPHMRSRPPSPPLSLSRSSTNHPESHTPPPPRDPQA